MLKQQKTLNFDCLQTSVLQRQKYVLSLPFAFFVCQNKTTKAKGFVFMFSQKARPNSFDFLTCLVERLFYAVLSVDYVFSQSLCLGPNSGPTDRPANR